MYRLRNRQTGIPQALRFYQPEINWTSRAGSFENVVQQIMRIRSSNPHHVGKHKWATDHDGVAQELDAYLAKICVDQGWVKFVASGPADPPLPSPPPRVKKARKCCGEK